MVLSQSKPFQWAPHKPEQPAAGSQRRRRHPWEEPPPGGSASWPVSPASPALLAPRRATLSSEAQPTAVGSLSPLKALLNTGEHKLWSLLWGPSSRQSESLSRYLETLLCLLQATPLSPGPFYIHLGPGLG